MDFLFQAATEFVQQGAVMAKQVGQDLYVTVLPQPGWPEWLKILVSAGVGARLRRAR